MILRAFGLAAVCAMFALADLRAAEGDTAAPATPAPVSITATPVVATAAAPAASIPAYPIKTSTGGSLQLGLYLVLLFGLLGGGVYIMKNGLGFLQPKPKGPRKLEVSETRMLGNRQFLIVAEYEQRKMLIGVCPGRIDYLCTLAGGEPEFPKLPSEEEA